MYGPAAYNNNTRTPDTYASCAITYTDFVGHTLCMCVYVCVAQPEWLGSPRKSDELRGDGGLCMMCILWCVLTNYGKRVT